MQTWTLSKVRNLKGGSFLLESVCVLFIFWFQFVKKKCRYELNKLWQKSSGTARPNLFLVCLTSDPCVSRKKRNPSSPPIVVQLTDLIPSRGIGSTTAHECEIDAGCIQYYLLALLAGTIILASRVGIVPNFHVFCTLPCALFRHLMVVSRLDNRQSLIWQSWQF